MIGLDTNVLLRYFAGDHPLQSRIATRLIEHELSAEEPGHVSLVSLAELVWVLRTSYSAQRMEIADVVNQLLAGPRFVVQEANAVWAAIDTFEQDNVDFSDALIVALNRLHGCHHTVSFDRGAARMPEVALLS